MPEWLVLLLAWLVLSVAAGLGVGRWFRYLRDDSIEPDQDFRNR